MRPTIWPSQKVHVSYPARYISVRCVRNQRMNIRKLVMLMEDIIYVIDALKIGKRNLQEHRFVVSKECII